MEDLETVKKMYKLSEEEHLRIEQEIKNHKKLM